MARFFISENLINGNLAVITGSDVKHIVRVLRLGPGDIIYLAAGVGREFEARIKEITKNEVICELIAEKNVSSEPPVKVTLFQGMPKADKLDTIIQKTTELGVNKIVPVICERTVVKFDWKKAADRRRRWLRIAEEAAKQAQRTFVPDVTEPVVFNDAVDVISAGVLSIIPWEKQQYNNNNPIGKVLKENRLNKEIFLFIGPEGGFSEQEVEIAMEKGVIPVSLGPRILRTETAGIVSVALVLYQLGDLGGSGDN